MQFHQTRLDNDLTVVAETNPEAQSVAVGLWVRTGSRDETEAVSGVSHFLEHMAFKGNDRYTAEDVNRIFDEVGARYNASTSEEVTLYYAAVLPEYLPQTFDLLSALAYPSLRKEDFDVEKKVILEEIGMYEDQPTFVAYTRAMESHFMGHPLARSILGTTDSITALTAEQMRNYHRDHYKAGNIVVAVAGNVEWSLIQDLVDQHCGHWPPGTFDRPVHEARPPGVTRVLSRENTSLQYVMQMAPAPAARDEQRYAADLLSVVVGDDSGSRLYWELVDPGHAEAAEVGFNEYDGCGTWLTYLSGSPQNTPANLERIRAVYERVNDHGVTQEELDQARNKVASRIVLRGERPTGRLSALGSNWVYRNEYRSIQDDLDKLASITTDDVRKLLETYPLQQTTTVAVGPLQSLE